jgi:hypothetical protein
LDNEKNAEKSKIIVEERFVCSCGKSFKYQSGLCKHKKKCNIDCSEQKKETVDEPVNSSLIQNLIYQNKELQNMIVKQQSQYEDTLKEIIPKIGNTINNNQQYTIQMFLNDKCKNALNLEDFINSLQITLDDLDITTNRGLIEGVTYSVLKGLEKLQIHERPIHCSDLKREIMYIKDQDAWNRDQNNDMLKQSINKVADKQLKSFPKWEEGHPDYLDNDLEQEKYMQFMGNATVDLSEDPKAISKIIKNVGKEVYISKDNIVNEN